MVGPLSHLPAQGYSSGQCLSTWPAHFWIRGPVLDGKAPFSLNRAPEKEMAVITHKEWFIVLLLTRNIWPQSQSILSAFTTTQQTNAARRKHAVCSQKEPSFVGLETKVLPALKALVKSWDLEEQLRSYKNNSSISTSCVLRTLHISPYLKLITLKVILFSNSKTRKLRCRKVQWHKFFSWNFAFNCKTPVSPSSAHWTGSTSCDTQHMILY